MQKFAAVKKELIPNSAARRVFGLIGSEMGLIEAEFERQVSSNIQVINYLGDYLRASGGKRIRPALLVLAHHAIDKGERAESVIRMATVMEMLHAATLDRKSVV